MTRARLRVLLPLAAALAIVVPLAWMWQASLLPDTYAVTEMGEIDTGGGPAVSMAGMAGHAAHGGTHDGSSAGGSQDTGTSIATLTGPQDGEPDVAVTLTARKEKVELASGREVDGYTLNGTTPGPTIEAEEGDLVEVRLVNESVPDGATIHWHGLDVPNAEDGVAGVTQDAVAEGEEHTYRFVADQVGTYWYHSHQVSHVQVKKGLLGALVVRPEDPLPQAVDAVAVAHTYSARTLNGEEGAVRVEAEPGDTVRVRLVNTDNTALDTWADVPFRVVALDGYDVNEPTDVEDLKLLVTAGGRADLELTVPALGAAARVQVSKATWLVIGPADADEPEEPPQPRERLDVLAYGSPTSLPFDPEDADRTFRYDIGRRPGFVDGRPGMWWSINGKLFPDVPMYVVEEGDLVVMDLKNGSGETHPMHLHGHHAVVLSHNGQAASGSPFWMDSLEVASGDSYRIAFVADNPGIWMDHCHNLPHATQGLVAHLMYAGMTTPYKVGHADNHPE